MTTVVLKKAQYTDNIIEPVVGQMLDNLGKDKLNAGTRVLIKPNLLMPATPDKAITTHPLLVRKVVEYLLERGARVQVSDSPPVGNFRKILRETGYIEALDGLDVTIKPFEKSVPKDIGKPFGRIDIAQDVVEADLIINLAKLKTHMQMLLSMGVKNNFGCIVGLRKPEWHMRTGVDRQLFARLLVQICEAVAPAYTIIDGILALQGHGPGKNGEPHALGILAGGTNVYAVDKTVCTLVGVDPADLPTYQQARALSVFDGEVHVNGNIEIADDFQLPTIRALDIVPQSLNRFMRRYVIQKPVSEDKRCKLCGECWKICPAKVIGYNTRGVRFDYDKCIRCYCCLEICPHGAIEAKEPFLGKMWQWLK